MLAFPCNQFGTVAEASPLPPGLLSTVSCCARRRPGVADSRGDCGLCQVQVPRAVPAHGQKCVPSLRAESVIAFTLGPSAVDVNGKNTHQAYQFLKGVFPGDITWNFASKFIVDRNGVPVRR